MLAWLKNRPLVLAVCAVLVVGFLGGWFAAKASDALRTGPDGGGFFGVSFGHPRDAHAPRAGLPKPEGFAVWRQRVDTTHADPQVCIEFTRPLDPGRAYGDFVLVSPDPGRPPAVTVHETELCLGGLGFFDRRVTFLKGLPARGGETLKANADVDITFGEKPPYVGFAGEGVILPRQDGDGVGIETVNIAKLSVEVWRVPDRNLVRKSISAPEATGEGEFSGDYGDDSPDDEGRVVWKGEVQVHASGGQRATTVFPLGAVLKELKPGAYVIKARDASGGRDTKLKNAPEGDPPAQARRWILYTDMALVAYRGAEGLDVVVRSLKTAQPMGGVKVDLVAKNGETLDEERSDDQGHVRFQKALLGGDGAAAAKMVMAYGPGADFTVLDLDRPPVDLSNQGVGGRELQGPALTAGRKAAPVIDSYVYADRGVYRPGETVHLVALLRDAQARSVKDRKGALVIKRPSGVEAARVAFAKTPDGFAAADYALAKTAARGRWTAELQIDGLDEPAGKATFSVEDFAPQRLAVDLDAKPGQVLAGGEKRAIAVNARFLYGAPGAGLKVEGEARVKVDHDPFPRFKDFQWGDAQTPYEEKQMDLPATVTDGAGKAVLSFDTNALKDTAEPLKALITANVFEPGGRPVSEGATLSIHPRSLFLGVKVDQPDNGGMERLIGLDVIAVNAQGARVAASGVDWSLISENWTYDWFQDGGRWNWRRTSHDVVIARGTMNVGAGDPAKLAHRLGWGDYRLQLEEPRTHARTVVRFTSGWGASAESADAPDTLRLSAGTEVHAQGDGIDVTIKAPYAGQAQLAVATDRLIQLKNLAVPEGGTTVHLKSSPAWGGGAYVLVSVIQPRNPVTTPKPRRALGVLYVPLDPKSRKLEVELGTPDRIRGTEPVVVPVRVRGLHFGQRAKITIAAVDQGILNLTKFQSPDPVKWYFGKRALGVDYQDDYGRLLDPNLGAAAKLNYGADELGGQGLTTTPIKTVALWSGVVSTELDGTARVVLPKAAFNGELRIMAVAWTDEAVGSAEKKLVVREPVVAELDLPRFLAPGDHAQATLELHNLEGKPGAYTADVSGAGGLDIAFHKVIQLALGQRITDTVPVNAPSRSGVGQVTFRASGPGFDQTQGYGLETRSGWGPQTRVTTALQRPGEVFTPGPDTLAGFVPGSASLQVSYSPFEGFDPAPIADALTKYPYGCTEQLVSGAYPWLYLAPGLGGAKTGRAPVLLSQAVGRLLDRQAADGAFGLWKAGDGLSSAWLGAYATDFLVEARAHGVPVPDEAVDRALNAMRLISRPDGSPSISYRLDYPKWWWGGGEDATARLRSQASAYALYVMAKVQGHGDLARLRWYHDVQFKTEGSPLARAQVGAGLSRMGDQARAHDAFRQAVDALGYRQPQDEYQSPLRDLAGVIALAYEAHEPEIARRLQGRLNGAVKDPDALNTQEQAFLLQAAGAMLHDAGPLRIEASGVTRQASPDASPRWGVGRLASARFVNHGSGGVWRTVTVRGPVTAEPAPQSHGLSLDKQWFTLQGGTVDASHLAQGARIVVKISGRSQQGRTLPLIIDDALPAGFEIETVLSPEDAKSGPYKFLGELHEVGAQESRDDRYIAALDVAGNDGFAVAYIMRAVTPGEFYRPGAEARDMYKAGVFARTAGGRVKVDGR
jgi:uncharacterized protein YfaS (alpha-2-macroglobulin family)